MRPILILPLLLACTPLHAGDFKREVAPILKSKCWSCHSEQAKKEKAGYVFDNLERFAKDIGRAGIVVPGDSSRSRLYEVVAMEESGDNAMPPSGKPRLTPKELKAIREWIEDGATLDKAGNTAPAGGKAGGLPPPPVLLDWTNAQGKTIKASFVKLDGEKVTIRMKDGKQHTLELSVLDEASQKQARDEALKEAKSAVQGK